MNTNVIVERGNIEIEVMLSCTIDPLFKKDLWLYKHALGIKGISREWKTNVLVPI